MKRTILRKVSSSIEKTMLQKNISPKELAQKSRISYSSLIPIINGARDFGISKLIAIANALGCTPDKLLSDLISVSNDIASEKKNISPKYLISFVSVISVTYCMFYEVSSKNKITTVLKFSLGCGQDPDEFLDRLITYTQEILLKEFKQAVTSKDLAIFVSVQQYEWALNRAKIQQKGEDLFAKFIVESDAITSYHTIFHNKNGILITINDGDSIAYSITNGNDIIKIQGYGFPISDIAGNHWIGCEAIRHVINVKEGIEISSLLSDKILALFNDDLYYLSESLVKEPENVYSKASSIVKELLSEEHTSFEIVKKSASLLFNRIKILDNQLKIKLPIALTGDLANLYKGFFPKNRIIKYHDKASTSALNYGINYLQKNIASDNDL